MNVPKIIFLDWNKTLSDSIFWQQLTKPEHKLNNKLSEIESVLFDKNFNLVTPWMLGKLTSYDICKFISEKIGIKSKLLHNELEISCKKMTIVNKKIENLLKKIKQKKISLVIATDNMDTFTNYTYPIVNKNKLFDGFLNSYELGCFKYDYTNNSLPFFDNYLKTKHLTYKNVVLIDDSIDKKGNFQRLGFKIININKKKSLIEVLKLYAKT